MKFNVKYYASLENMFSDLSIPFTKGKIGPASALAADIVGLVEERMVCLGQQHFENKAVVVVIVVVVKDSTI